MTYRLTSRDPEGLATLHQPDVVDRLASQIEDGPADECWRWTGAHDREGYPVFSMRSKTGRIRVLAQRAQTALALGSVPDDHMAALRCGHHWCVNPAHAMALLPVAVVARSIEHGTHYSETERRRSHCDAGHPYTDANTAVWRRRERVCLSCKRSSRSTRRAKDHAAAYARVRRARQKDIAA